MSFSLALPGAIVPLPLEFTTSDDEVFYQRCVTGLVHSSQISRGNKQTLTQQLAATLVSVTDGDMYLNLFAIPAIGIPSPSPPSPGNRFPVCWNALCYGYLQVQVPQKALPSEGMLTIATNLASTCGWLLQSTTRLAHLDHQLAEIDPDVLARLATLSARERDVLALVGQGYPSATVAKKLSISCKTVSTHRHHIYVRLGLKKAVSLDLIALASGLI